MLSFINRHADKILGTISCFDRILVTGTFSQICYAQAMASHLTANDVRLLDYPLWASCQQLPKVYQSMFTQSVPPMFTQSVPPMFGQSVPVLAFFKIGP